MGQIRNVNEQDYTKIIPVINEWWGGRQMSDMLPKLFFVHFQPTSFVIEAEGEIIAFLIGFLSQTNPEEAYIHFVGVHPERRGDGVGKELYQMFFQEVKKRGCHTVRCITSPVNKGSIHFHGKMGFEVEAGDKVVDGVWVTTNYDGRGNDRVQLVKRI
ncbi:N-acetyltransferase [Brevibacillus reuszeri]|uniref:GNAT family N-acetyltransferase n=1 Tax=Brevibacillus reuszeri TaxID=54915 RepID=UPI001B1FDB5A|nr:GNAT family N-acetyltransferase [Brevibacillus reuszeri]GIO07158.1 N-acetyltransferase [Brevibacillus reuszeri]